MMPLNLPSGQVAEGRGENMPIDEKFLASRKRKVLAWYLDFLLYLAFFELLGYFGGFFGLHILIKVTVFVLIEFLLSARCIRQGVTF